MSIKVLKDIFSKSVEGKNSTKSMESNPLVVFLSPQPPI